MCFRSQCICERAQPGLRREPRQSPSPMEAPRHLSSVSLFFSAFLADSLPLPVSAQLGERRLPLAPLSISSFQKAELESLGFNPKFPGKEMLPSQYHSSVRLGICICTCVHPWPPETLTSDPSSACRAGHRSKLEEGKFGASRSSSHDQDSSAHG